MTTATTTATPAATPTPSKWTHIVTDDDGVIWLCSDAIRPTGGPFGGAALVGVKLDAGGPPVFFREHADETVEHCEGSRVLDALGGAEFVAVIAAAEGEASAQARELAVVRKRAAKRAAERAAASTAAHPLTLRSADFDAVCSKTYPATLEAGVAQAIEKALEAPSWVVLFTAIFDNAAAADAARNRVAMLANGCGARHEVSVTHSPARGVHAVRLEL